MNHKISIYLLLSLFMFFSNCKKKTSIQVKVYNPRLDEYVPNATVVLFENNFGLNFGLSTKDISTSITNEEGIAYFDNIRLKKSNKHEYHVTLKDAWGISNPYMYDTKSYEGALNKGSTSIFTLYDTEPNAEFDVKYNNVFNPAQINDSISVLITSVSIEFTEHSLNYTIGGDTIFKKTITYDPMNSPYPATLNFNSINYKASRLIVKITKLKMGLPSTIIDTVKTYPNKNNQVIINW